MERFSNRATAYLGLNQFDHALEDLEFARKIEHFPSDGYLQMIATVQWIAGDHLAALSTWRSLTSDVSQGKIKYTDGSGGLQNGFFLWFAGFITDSQEDITLNVTFR